jgi:PAS domain S-box-containing protein
MHGSREALGELLQLLPEAAIVVEDRTRIVMVNSRAAELIGCSPSQVVDAPLVSVLTDGSAPAPGAPRQCTLLRKDGRRLPVEVSFGEVGPEGLVLGIVRDTTGRKLAEDELRKSEERLRQAVRVSEIGIFDHDHATDRHYWTARQREMYGWPDDEPITVPTFLARLHPDDRDAIGAGIRRAHDPKGDGSFDVEHRIIRSDGELRWISTRSITLFAGEGPERRPVRTVGASVDFTDRKLGEEGRERLAAVLDVTPDLVALVDPSGRLLYVNRSGREILGIDPGDDLSKVRIEDWRPEWAAKMLAETAIPAAMRDGAWRGETAFVDAGGFEVPFSQVVLAHRRHGGDIAFLSTVARDVSNERKLEAQFLQAQKMEAIGRLAGGVAHDFNNLLSVILNAATLAQKQLPKGHPCHADLEDVRLAGERAAELTRRMLAFSRKQVLRPQIVDVNEVLRGMAPMLRRLVREHIEQVMVLAHDLHLMKADPSHLEQVILNLVINACDAMPAGGTLTIATRNASIDERPTASQIDPTARSLVTIAVSDTGVGMDAATRAKIFEPFFTTKGIGQGTGLGLAMVFGTVQQSGGDISVESEPAQGTIFTLYFPSTTDEAVARPAPPATVASLAGSEVVLLVEDEGQLRKLVASVLRRSGYQVIAAAGPLEALTLSRGIAGPIDLLLTDVVMPQMSGKELADRLATERPATRVLFMSGYAEQSILGDGLVRSDRPPFLQKPFTFDDLLATVRRVLGGDPSP